MSSFETDIFTPLMSFINTEARTIIGKTVPCYGGMYIVPDAPTHESSPEVSTSASKSPDTSNFGQGHQPFKKVSFIASCEIVSLLACGLSENDKGHCPLSFLY